MSRSAEQTRLYDSSGRFKSNNPVVSLFYDIMIRGHISPGELHLLVNEARIQPADYTNGHVAKYAYYLSDLLMDIVSDRAQLEKDTEQP